MVKAQTRRRRHYPLRLRVYNRCGTRWREHYRKYYYHQLLMAVEEALVVVVVARQSPMLMATTDVFAMPKMVAYVFVAAVATL